MSHDGTIAALAALEQSEPERTGTAGPRRAASLLLGANAEAQGWRRPAETFVQTEQLEARERAASDERGRQVQCVKRSDRLARERLPRPSDDLRTDPQDVPVGGGRHQVSPSIGGVRFSHLTENGRTEEHTVAFD